MALVCLRCRRANRDSAGFCDACGAPLGGEFEPGASPAETASLGELFLGRERELGALNAAIDPVLSGRGRIFALAGEPGIGKTRTAQVFAHDAQSNGLHVYWGRCHEEPGAPPYWPWQQLLRGYLEAQSADAPTAVAFEDAASTLAGGPTLWPLEKSAEVLRWYREFITRAPRELNGFFAFLTVPPVPMFPQELHLKKTCGVVWCYAGPAENAEKVFEPVKKFGPPALYGIHAIPFPSLQSVFDGLYPKGHQWYWRADFVNELSDAAIALHAEHGARLPTLQSTMHLYPIDGKAHDVGKSDTAFTYRSSNWASVIVGVDPDPANKSRITDWTKSYFDALHPYSAGGAYVNFMMDEGQERVQATYGDNYPRLAAVKRKYAPGNLFRVNQNIRRRAGKAVHVPKAPCASLVRRRHSDAGISCLAAGRPAHRRHRPGATNGTTPDGVAWIEGSVNVRESGREGSALARCRAVRPRMTMPWSTCRMNRAMIAPTTCEEGCPC